MCACVYVCVCVCVRVRVRRCVCVCVSVSANNSYIVMCNVQLHNRAYIRTCRHTSRHTHVLCIPKKTRKSEVNTNINVQYNPRTN